MSVDTREERKVLIVEDHPDSKAMLGELVRRRFDCEVVLPSSVAGALAAVDRDSFDCIVSDFDMPGQTGLDLAQELKDRGKSIPMLFYTGADLTAADSASFEFVLATVRKPDFYKLILTLGQKLGWKMAPPRYGDSEYK